MLNGTDTVEQITLDEFNPSDARWMSYALALATEARMQADPNPHVGCVIVREGSILGEGCTQVAGQAHAEQAALNDAHNKNNDVTGATAYVTLEPCAHYGRTSPCAEALIKAELGEVVIATLDPNPRVSGSGIQKIRAAGIRIRYGLMQAEANELNRGFMQRMRTGRPFVIAKMAVSADGRSALPGGESAWITNEESRSDVHQIRAQMSAILTTASTVNRDNPKLNARMSNTGEEYPRQPLRVILDSGATVSNQAQTFHLPGAVLLFVAEEYHSSALEHFSEYPNVEIVALPTHNKQFNLRDVMNELGAHEVNNVLIEAGAHFQGQCVAKGLVDELIMYIAPHLLGESPFGILRIPESKNMRERIQLKLQDVTQFEHDVRITYRF